VRGLARAMICLSLLAAHARADETDPRPSTPAALAAEALFQEAKVLIRDGKHGEACPKLAESHRLDPAGGTVLTLALCHQAVAQLASAWVRYREAIAFAKRDGRSDRLEIAETRITEIEPRLSRITIALDPKTRALSGLELTLDGTRLGDQAIDVELPVDGGAHTLQIAAPGYRTRSLRFEIEAEKARKRVVVPALEAKRTRSTPAPSRPNSDPPPAETRSRVLTWTALGVGSVGALAAVGFGVAAKQNHDTAIERCPASPCSDAEGVAANDRARNQATVATVAGGIGVLGFSAFALLLVTENDSRSMGVTLSGDRLEARFARRF